MFTRDEPPDSRAARLDMGRTMDSSSQRASSRYLTWPLAGFILGFLIAPPPRPTAQFGAPEPGDVLIVGFGAGCVLALVGLMTAMGLDGRGGPTKSALPFSEDRPGQAALFTLCFVASTWLKTFGHWGILAIGLGVVPVLIVLRGGSSPAASDPTPRPPPSGNPKPPRPVFRWRPKLPGRPWLMGVPLALAWAGYSWVRYDVAMRRAFECRFALRGPQAAICFRHAIEARDSVVTWGIGVPLAVLMLAAVLAELLGQRQSS